MQLSVTCVSLEIPLKLLRAKFNEPFDPFIALSPANLDLKHLQAKAETRIVVKFFSLFIGTRQVFFLDFVVIWQAIAP